MKENQQNTIKTIVIIALVAYFLFLTYRAIAYNYKTNKTINSLNTEITLLEAEKEYLEYLNVYYDTDTYKELEARRKLGLKRKGETVIKVPVDPERLAQIERREVIQNAIENVEKKEQENNMSIPRKWLKFVLRI